jgi:hypothetical protein
MLDKVLRRSDALDKESLCVLAGQRVSLFSLHFSYPYSAYPLLFLMPFYQTPLIFPFYTRSGTSA